MENIYMVRLRVECKLDKNVRLIVDKHLHGILENRNTNICMIPL
jgi:hypothetical protein